MSRRTTFSFAWACALFVASTFWANGSRTANAQGVTSSTLNLGTDAASITVHTVVHLTASLQTSGSAATGSVTFLDGPTAIASVSLNAEGIAVLGVASLGPGPHTLTATYSGDATHAAATSGTVAVGVTGLAAPFTISPTQISIYANQTVTLTTAGLPAFATGSVSFLDGSTSLANAAVGGAFLAGYQAFGDGITSGQTVSLAQSYPSLFASADGFSMTNFGAPSSVACDILPSAILSNGIDPTQTSAPLTSLMVGSTDVDNYGGAYLSLFTACDQAALAWLAIPREYKVLPGDPGAAVTSGSWTANPNTGVLQNTAGAGTLAFNITANSGPVYFWYLLGDALPGTFTLTIDGVAGNAVYSTQPTPAIDSINHSPSVGFALLRFPLSAGPHTLEVNVQSGTVGILGAATPPSPGAASVHPTVLVSDIPNQLSSAPTASPGLIATYTQAIQSSVSQFQADGLDVRLVPTQQTMLGTPPEMTDSVNPNPLGQSHLAQAFESTLGTGSTSPYSVFAGTSPTASVTFSIPGTHTITATYSGDSTYATGSSSPMTITVLPQNVSFTSLLTRTTSYPSGSPVVLTATVSPASAAGTVTFYDGTALLSQTTLTDGVATVTTETLALGLHQLSALYSGDAPDAPSASPALAVQITPGAALVTLTPVSATVPYGTLAPLIATVSPASASGTVTFQDSVTGTLGQAIIVGGTATLNAASLTIGNHILTASYSGDNTHLPATSAAATITITGLLTTTTLVAQPAQITFGSVTSLTAAISPPTAGGSVIFKDSSSGVLGTATVTAGSAVLNTSTLPAGLRSISASYSGDATHASSLSALATVAVSVAPSTVTLTSLPASTNTGTPLTLTATVTPATATGTLIFRNGIAGILGQATINHGAASLLLFSLPAGMYAITAEYPGDAQDGGSSSSPVFTQVVLQSSQTTLAISATPVPYSTTISLAASVSPSTAGGVMSFYDGAIPLGQAPLIGGVAGFKITTLATGSHQLHVVYSGDEVYAASTSPTVSASITPASTATALSLAEANVPLGAPVVFNVRVSTASASMPGGTVVIRANGVVLTSGSLANTTSGVGYATLSVASAVLGFGTFSVTASYSGDLNDLPSNTSASPVSVAVVSSETSTSLKLSPTQVPPQNPVTLTASVHNPSPATPTGAIEFLVNGAVLATVPLDGTGSAMTVLGAQPVGSYSLSAQYLPSGSWASSVSGPQTLTVTLPLAIVLTPDTVSLAAGASTTVTLGLTPLSGYRGTMQAQCASSAPFLTCSIDPLSPITAPVSGQVHLTVAQNTLGAFLPRTRSQFLQDSSLLACLVPLLIRRRKPARVGRSILALGAITLLSGCATGGDFGSIPPGRQLVVVTVNAAGTTTTAGVAVQVTP